MGNTTQTRLSSVAIPALEPQDDNPSNTHTIARAKQLLQDPHGAWKEISKERGGLKDVYFPYTLITGLMPLLAGAILGSFVWGPLQSAFGGEESLRIGVTFVVSIIQYVWCLVSLLALSKITELVSENFGLKKSWVLSSRVFVYGSTPSLLVLPFAGIPMIGRLLSLGGMIWSLCLIAEGFKYVLKKDVPKDAQSQGTPFVADETSKGDNHA